MVLASRSPRRCELLRSAGIPFAAIAADVDETARRGEIPEEYAVRVAEKKAMAVAAGNGDIVLGSVDRYSGSAVITTRRNEEVVSTYNLTCKRANPLF